jgi:hypothetical protein
VGPIRGSGRQRPDERIDRTDVTRNPSNAICRCIAEGEDGDRVGVFGSSENNIGVFARSHNAVGLFARGGQGESAAEFYGGVRVVYGRLFVDGDVRVVGGRVFVDGKNLLAHIQALEQRVEELEATLATFQGGSPPPPPPPPASRPQISVVQSQKCQGGGGSFQVTGSGFQNSVDIYWEYLNANQVDNHQGGLNYSNQSWPLNLACWPGNRITFRATDGRNDPNDPTQQLWSNEVTVTCT